MKEAFYEKMPKRELTILTIHNRTFTFIYHETNNIRQRQFLDRIQDMFRWNTSSVY